MTTRSVHYFMRTSEFADLVQEVARDQPGFVFVLRRLGAQKRLEVPAEPGSIVMSDGLPADRVYISKRPVAVDRLDPNDLKPADWGWLLLEVPREQDSTLHVAQVGAKSAWYNERTQEMEENPTSIEIFEAVAPYIRRRLRRPVWAQDARGGTSRAYRNIGFTSGAAQWEESGGELRQLGVSNVRYSLHPPVSQREARP